MSGLIIAVAGWATVGKDSVGDVLARRYGFRRVAFADKVRELAREIGWNGVKDAAGRRLLQDVGLGARRILGENVWIDAALRDLPRNGRYVITDCRFRNEADAVKSLGGYLVRVVRPDVGPVNCHVSETDLDRYPPDAVIENSGTLADLEVATCRLADRLLGLATVIPLIPRERSLRPLDTGVLA